MIKMFSIRQKLGWLLASFVVGIACWWTLIVVPRELSNRIELGGLQLEKEIDSNIPQPKHSPSDVVTLQVNSMRDAVADINKLRVCYSLASPENRKNTGPFLRFAELVMAPPYDRLANCKDWQVGDTIINKNFAAVLVSTTSKEGELSAFRFVLQRQESQRADCWLTEGVQFIEQEPVGLRPNTEKENTEMELDRKVECLKRRRDSAFGLKIDYIGMKSKLIGSAPINPTGSPCGLFECSSKTFFAFRQKQS